MSYLYCAKCNWSQEFWSWGYNPLRYFVCSMLPWLWKPRIMNGDPPTFPCFSWWLLLKEACRALSPRRYWNQKWWTWGSWQRAVRHEGNKQGREAWPTCQVCQANALRVD